MEDALRAYGAGRADGAAGRHDAALAEHPATGPDYRVGVADGQLEIFENDLIAAVRQALGAKAKPGAKAGAKAKPGAKPMPTAEAKPSAKSGAEATPSAELGDKAVPADRAESGGSGEAKDAR
jgi:hypothetical protein